MITDKRTQNLLTTNINYYREAHLIKNKLELPEEELGDELVEESRELVSDSLVELASDSLDTLFMLLTIEKIFCASLVKSSSRALFFSASAFIIKIIIDQNTKSCDRDAKFLIYNFKSALKQGKNV
ncbi:hypothetical protein RIR_jg19960.t1 [Rhizophagus irregularis DAOM 181602=DAOM 197198]|nr:hypothetical protein RIR_jg19960.t1 [Rhizophagus irregularis DAOM 181602=DAOM 197198]